MIFALLLAAALSSQVFAVSQAWLHRLAPDPIVLVAAFVALYWPQRGLLMAAVVVGWVRSLVLLQPAGGQILCAWVAIVVVGGLRGALRREGGTGFLFAALLVAGCWSLLDRLLASLVPDVQAGGRELLLGAVLALPLAGLAARLGRTIEPAR